MHVIVILNLHKQFKYTFDTAFIQSLPFYIFSINKLRIYTMSLYDEIGGEAAVNAAVDIFYRKVLQDDRIKQFFDGVDMDKQAAKQKSFLTMAFGGPNNYTGEDMRKGHAHLVAKGLNDSHFDAVVEDLGATLTELNVPANLIAQVAAIAETTRNDILGR